MSRILLGVSGSVASVLTPKLISELGRLGELQVVATKASRYFAHDPRVWQDSDDWPGAFYHPGQAIPHIDLGDWADVLVVAPLSANTLTKFAVGISDNLLSCVLYAWPSSKPVIVAPAMNTRMWENPLTARHLSDLQARYDLTVVNPVSKKLACGTVGVGAMADMQDLAFEVHRVLQHRGVDV